MLKDKKNIIIGIIALVIVAGLSIISVKAAERFSPVTINNVENLTMNVEGSVDDMGDMLGASGTRFPHGISADSTSPSAGEVRGTTLNITGATALSSTLTVSGEIQAQRIVEGGSVANASSTLTDPLTLTAAQVCDNSVITVNDAAVAGSLSVASIDITLPATSTLFADCLDATGDSISFLFVNASPTAASTTEMIAGTGCESFKSQDTGGADTVPGLGMAKITLTRATDYMGVNAVNDCIMTVEPFVYD